MGVEKILFLKIKIKTKKGKYSPAMVNMGENGKYGSKMEISCNKCKFIMIIFPKMVNIKNRLICMAKQYDQKGYMYIKIKYD